MVTNHIPDSFSTDDDVVVDGPDGQRVHRDLLAHTERLERKLWTVRPGVWCLVGNGLSNQTFIEAPDGLTVVREEVKLAAERKAKSAPLPGAVRRQA